MKNTMSRAGSVVHGCKSDVETWTWCSNVCKDGKINDSWICTRSGNDHLGAMLLCDSAYLVIVDCSSLLINPVGGNIEQSARETGRAAVGKVAPV